MRMLVPVLAALALGVPGQDLEEEWKEVQKLARGACKPLRLLPTARQVREVEPDLPPGIVIESGPFDQLIARLVATQAPHLEVREQVLHALVRHPGKRSGKIIQDLIQLLVKEAAELERHLLPVEASYAEVWDVGYMEASEGQRAARKTAATLIPYYRSLMYRDAALVELAVEPLLALAREDPEWLLGTGASDREPHLRAMSAAALGLLGGGPARARLTELVVDDDRSLVRRHALAALLRYPLREMQEVVAQALGDRAWEVRALACRIAVQGRLLAAVGPMIEAIALEDGRLRHDLDEALFALVGTRMYGDADLWQEWWREHQEEVEEQARQQLAQGELEQALGPIEGWTPRELTPAAPGEGEGELQGTTSFYGITSASNRIVYIIDISTSMEKPAEEQPRPQGAGRHPYAEPAGSSKLDIACWQLHRAIHDLPADGACNIIVYSESYAFWQPYITPLKGRGRARAHKFIDRLRPGGTTNICDPLERAFCLTGAGPLGAGGGRGEELAADTIFLLSDGAPNRGRVAGLQALLEEIDRQNRLTSLVIHTIGIGEATEEASSTFLRDLARRTGGQYVEFR